MWAGLSLLLRIWREAGEIEVDLRPEVDAAFANRHANAFVGIVGILFRVADDDAIAAAPHQLVESHVVKMASVGEIDIGRCVGDAAKQLLRQPEWHVSGCRAG